MHPYFWCCISTVKWALPSRQQQLHFFAQKEEPISIEWSVVSQFPTIYIKLSPQPANNDYSCNTVPKCMMTSSNENIFRVAGHLCGEFTVTSEFPTQRAVPRSFDIFFDLHLNKRLSKQSWGWWFETPSHPLWHHCNSIPVTIVYERNTFATGLLIYWGSWCKSQTMSHLTVVISLNLCRLTTTTKPKWHSPPNIWYKSHLIPILKCFSSRLAVVFSQSIEAMC